MSGDPRPSFPREPAHVTMPDGCAYTGDSRTTMYNAIIRGEVEAVKQGNRTLLVFASLKKRVAARKPAIMQATRNSDNCAPWDRRTPAAVDAKSEVIFYARWRASRTKHGLGFLKSASRRRSKKEAQRGAGPRSNFLTLEHVK